MTNEPLGLPKGSVRSIITLPLVVVTAFLTVKGLSADVFVGFTGMALAYYFKTRSDEANGAQGR